MIYSMTAFARVQNVSDKGNFVCEIRSINHRYLDISLYLPEVLRAFEMPIREKMRELLKRGKIECNVRYQPSSKVNGNSFNINPAFAQELCSAAENIAKMMKTPAPLQPLEVLRFPGVIEMKEVDTGELKQETFTLIEKALSELIAARGREGEELKKLFMERIEQMQQQLIKVRERLPNMLAEARERLVKRFHDVRVELDPTRLEQEMVMFAQKIDVSEEIDRTATHLHELVRILKEGGLVGRRLDFLMQELNREANTLGSKSVDPVLTHAAVDLKVLIEQMREQVQNVE